MLNAVQTHRTLSLQDVIQFGTDLMVVFFRPLDVDGVNPGSHSRITVLNTDHLVAMTTGAPLSGGFGLVANVIVAPGWELFLAPGIGLFLSVP